jgi:hypothetical protein
MQLIIAPEVLQKKAEREKFVRLTKNAAKIKAEKLRAKDASIHGRFLELLNICRLLHQLAQRYVPRTPQAFVDFDSLTHATKTLQRMGMEVIVASDICAPTKSVERGVVFNSPEYRELRNKFIAALATIADMTDKNTPPGDPEYQRGVREGYRRASDIAILFLEDVQNGIN